MQNICDRSWLDPVFRKKDEIVVVAAEISDFIKPICFYLVVSPLPFCFFVKHNFEVFFIIMHIRKIIGTLGEVHCCIILCFHSLVYFISELKEKIWVFPMSTIPRCYLSHSEIQFCMLLGFESYLHIEILLFLGVQRTTLYKKYLIHVL